ncbi:MAG: DUF72 domain-containing protein [Coriobacteriales bacterium]|nr:DUF72 domain-containing protein [Coriobacteriales bacterium]
MRIGTSGWSYDHWRDVFYPEHLATAERLPFYAERFNTVEVNATFYRLPTEHAVRQWRDEVPEDFAFAVKGSRLITHYRRLADLGDSVETFMKRVSLLGKKLHVVLWQLPPNLHCDPELLDGFLAGLPNDVRHAVEFRHESWLAEDAFEVLRRHNAAHVQVSSDDMPRNLTVTAEFVYLRFHGTQTYHGDYSAPALEPWAQFLRQQAGEGRGGYAYFNNDAEGHAPADAARLTAMLGGG